MNKTISNKINIIRVISMLCIVLCHYLQYYNNQFAFWFNVGVQIFFILSGVLYGCKDVTDFKKFWKNKVTKIILPYLLVISIFFAFCFITNNKPFKMIDIVYYFTMSQAFNTAFSSLAQLWFISYILLFYLIVPVLQKFDISCSKNFYLKLIFIIVGLQMLQFLNIMNVNVTYLGLFIVSYYFSRRYFKHSIQDNYKVLTIISIVVCLIGIPVQLYLQQYVFTGIIYKIFLLYCDYIHAFLGISIFLLLIKILPDIKHKIIDYFSNISYSIYLVHQIFILGTFSLLKYRYGILLSVVVIFVISNILYFLTNFINNKIIKK